MVDGSMKLFKMSSKQAIRDILCLGSTIYGLSDDSDSLYEWKPSIEKKKASDLYSVSMCNYIANIYQIHDPLITYLGFCDMPNSCGVAALYLVDNKNPIKQPEKQPKKNSVSRETRKDSLDNKGKLDKFKNLRIETKTINIEPEMPEQKQDPKQIYYEEFEKNKNNLSQYADPKEEFIAGVDAFKTFLQKKRATNPKMVVSSAVQSPSNISIKLRECPLNETGNRGGSTDRGNVFGAEHLLQPPLSTRGYPSKKNSQITQGKEREDLSSVNLLADRAANLKKKLNKDSIVTQRAEKAQEDSKIAADLSKYSKTFRGDPRKGEEKNKSLMQKTLNESKTSSLPRKLEPATASDRINSLRSKIMKGIEEKQKQKFEDAKQDPTEQEINFPEDKMLDSKMLQDEPSKEENMDANEDNMNQKSIDSQMQPAIKLVEATQKVAKNIISQALRKIVKFAENKELCSIIKKGILESF